MGNVYRKVFAKNPVRVLIMGLDAAGKTTMLYRLKLGEVVTTIPTIGFNVETITHKNVEITAWDVGFRDKMRPLMRHYYPNTDAITFLVDCTDRDRIDEVREDLHRMVSEPELQNAPVLVLANKQDLDKCMSTAFVTEKLELHKLRNTQWHIIETSALTGEGLAEGLDWLTQQLGYNQAKEAAKDIQDSATKVVSDNKTIVTGWSYAVCGLHKVKQWLWNLHNVESEE